MGDFIKQYWLQTLFGLIVSGLTYAVKKLYDRVKKEQSKEREEQALLKEGVLALLHDRIYQACQYHIQQREISVQDLNNLEYLYKGYSSLGGNGTGEELYKRCKVLPLIASESEQNEVA